MVWNYDYKGGSVRVPIATTDDENWTETTRPDGSVQLDVHGIGTALVVGNQKLRSVIRAADGTDMETSSLQYIWHPGPGARQIGHGGNDFFAERPRYVTQATQSRDGDTYVTASTYSTDYSDPDFAFGRPATVTLSGSVPGRARDFDLAYSNDTTNWKLAQPVSESINGEVAQTRTYDGRGRLRDVNKWGLRSLRYGYRGDGTVATVTDALDNSWSFSSWYRGVPRSVSSPLGHGISRTVDAFGQVTGVTDARGHSWTYEYDDAGRMTRSVPPAGFNDTTLSYTDLTSGVEVRREQGSALTTSTLSALLQPLEVFQQDTTSGWTSGTRTEYDNMGRTVFTSLPSTSAGGLPDGVRTRYDALGRTIETENTVDLTLTRVAFLPNNTTETTSPSGKVVTTAKSGEGGPGGGQVLLIDEGGGTRVTSITRNALGQPTAIQQGGSLGGSVTHTMAYHPMHKWMCAYYAPEHGTRRYGYDALRRPVTRSDSTATTPSCAAPSGDTLRTNTYDADGRLLRTDYAHSDTKDADFVYDAAGNVLRSRRGSLSGTTMSAITSEVHRGYDSLGNVTVQSDVIAGALIHFITQYRYDANGFMNYRRTPSNLRTTWENDGFGQQRNLAIYQEDAQGFPLPMSQLAKYVDNVRHHPDGTFKQSRWARLCSIFACWTPASAPSAFTPTSWAAAARIAGLWICAISTMTTVRSAP